MMYARNLNRKVAKNRELLSATRNAMLRCETNCEDGCYVRNFIRNLFIKDSRRRCVASFKEKIALHISTLRSLREALGLGVWGFFREGVGGGGGSVLLSLHHPFPLKPPNSQPESLHAGYTFRRRKTLRNDTAI